MSFQETQAYVFVVLAVFLAACSQSSSTALPNLSSSPNPVTTRPAPLRTSDAPLTQGTPGQYTVTVRGWAIDEVSGQRIEGARFLVVTVLGTYELKDSFEVSFPANTVLQVLAKADGYADNSTQMKPHYERNVQLEMQTPLSRSTSTPELEG